MRTFFFLLVLSFLCACEQEQPQPFDLVITNVNLIDGTGRPMQQDISVGIRDGRIVQIDSVLEAEGKETLNGSGKYLIPGLFDCHVHTNDFDTDFPRYIHYGVTSILITGGSLCTNEYYASMRERGQQDSIPAPVVFHTSQHFTMEGRHPVKTYGGNWIDGQSVFLLKDTLQIEKLVKRVSQNPIVGIKVTIEDGPHPPWVERIPQAFLNKIQKEATRHGTRVFAHVGDNIELEMALDAGIQNMVHWTGIDLDFERDSLLVQKIREVRPSFITTLMIDKGFLYPLFPEWVEAIRQEDVFGEEVLEKANDPGYIARSQDNIGFWKDYFQKEDVALRDIASFQVEDIQRLQAEGIRFALGTDTGTFVLPGYSLHEEMQLFELGGMDRMEILIMGTLNAAVMMQAQDSLGSVEVGKIANLVLLNRNPLDEIRNTMAIHSVIKNGRIQKRIAKD
ncbi:Imidazolonepropionase [Muriicola jejuensis]|uniref:Amidohydrolase family protein n=1 Tax=Muriicola jejuensis TaxID=504488 RepID=A0A6P0UI29_9FLAO|nr:amidohydrolase family protein [Muriicola jejuensis]NER09826.1 amidohydrolase family protein [Muriicola jejuensis]SMP05416.1 Imidazolonepropionase [Muriicola jejuensis]